MKLIKESKVAKMLVQLWNVDITSEASGASYVYFDKVFASLLMELLVQVFPRVPTLLLQLIRPKEYHFGLLVSYNWVDIIPYSISTIFRVYAFQGCRHVLPFQVPLLVGVAKIFVEIGYVGRQGALQQR